ncbi:MAG: 2-oxoacid:acceptor oxidoreductase family protein [Dehalococcoidia bacterium]|jgi:2-oxoglutarate ferredoxin oxidoreductase subunit gamma|nr:2-oxoacid:acceptor oxidoreductase family protein [Dehalococcoidia bacterium]
MGKDRQILLCGLGGQGVVLAGALLGQACFAEGLHVSGTSSYGSEARGGECRAEVVVSDRPVAFPYVTAADILVALSQSAYVRYLPWTVSPAGIVFYDAQSVTPAEGAAQRHFAIPATERAEALLGSKLGANIVMLGAVVAATSVASCDSVRAVVAEKSPARFRDINLRAVDIGFDLGRSISL